MSRDDGFDVADIDVGFLSDPKVTRLVRRLQDPHAVAAHLVLVLGAMLASWKAGERVAFMDALPPWWTASDEETEAIAALLRDVGYLDDDSRWTQHAWASWFGVAFDRREASRESWRRSKRKGRGTTASPDQAPSNGSPSGLHPDSGGSPTSPTVRPSSPSSPSVPSDRTASLAPARGATQPETVASILPRLVADTPAWRTPCRAFRDHQTHHHLAGGVWVCDVCETADVEAIAR